MKIILLISCLIQGCASSVSTLSRVDCDVLYFKGYKELSFNDKLISEIKSIFPGVAVPITEKHMVKWFSISDEKIAICYAIPDNNKCNSSYSFFEKKDGNWIKGNEMITICSAFPR